MERILTTDCPQSWMLASEAPHPFPCPLAFPNILLAFPNLEAAPRTQPWDSNGLLRPSGRASEWTLRHLYKLLRLQAWRSAHLPTPGTSNVRKLLWFLKLPLINPAPSTSFLGLPYFLWDQFQISPQKVLRLWTNTSNSTLGNVGGFLDLEDRKWWLSGMHPGKNETYQLKPTKTDFL